MNERDLLKKLRHPNILKLKSSWQDKENIYFLTDLAERGDLSRILKALPAGAIPRKCISFIVAQLVSALAYLHENGIAHRDLKPANILVTTDGNLLLCDFGTAYLSENALSSLEMKNHKQRSDSEEPEAQTFVGSKDYVSPEVLKSLGAKQGADIWSLACIIF